MNVRPRAGSAAVCSGCHQPAPGYDHLPELPVLFRGFAWFATESKPLAIQALGKSELVYAGTFGMLLVLGMQLP